MTDKEDIIQGGVPPEAEDPIIPADPVDQNKPPDNQIALQTDSRAGENPDSNPKGIDQEGEVVVASRKEAMAIRRRQFYFGKDRDGNNLLYEGAIAERSLLLPRHPLSRSRRSRKKRNPQPLKLLMSSNGRSLPTLRSISTPIGAALVRFCPV